MLSKNFRILYKVLFASLGLYAIAQETIVIIGRGTYDFVNFWSYFTNQSNLFTAIVLLVSAYALWRGYKWKHLDLFRGASTIYMIITGVVFALLLSGGDIKTLTAVPIDNTILHEIIPIALVIDWLIHPPAKRIPFVRSLLWLVYPIFYAACALVRGALTGWYPYPFFNPEPNGYGPVVVTIIGISAFVIAMAWLLTRLPLKRKKKK